MPWCWMSISLQVLGWFSDTTSWHISTLLYLCCIVAYRIPAYKFVLSVPKQLVLSKIMDGINKREDASQQHIKVKKQMWVKKFLG